MFDLQEYVIKGKGLEPQGVYATLISQSRNCHCVAGLALRRGTGRLCINCYANEMSRSQVQNRPWKA